MYNSLQYLVVGAGFAGAVLAERIASVLGKHVLLVDKRAVPGGNSASALDPETGIECHTYGSHIFHTSDEAVWSYVTRFSDFTSYRHQVLVKTGGRVCFMPINLKTLCDFFGRDISPSEAQALLAAAAEGDPATAQNLEEKAVSLIGRPLYEAFVEGYTRKQWNLPPSLLPASIINRLPVRTDFNTAYFSDPRQGVPLRGYFTLFKNLVSHPNIEFLPNTDFQSIRPLLPETCQIFYTGMLDEFFGFSLGHLRWRSLRFEWETLPVRDFQGTTVMNYADPGVPFTRIHEFKHYHPERRVPFESPRTVICREYPQDWTPGREAYYPVNDAPNQALFARYMDLAAALPNVHFCGRLASYRYWNMDQAIGAALSLFSSLFPS